MDPALTVLRNYRGTIHLVFSSHWDREWYLPFQKFRGKLIKVLDGVLAELESGRLPFYQMDGQFIPIEDYLEIRPGKETLLRELVAQGRLKIGPWYNLPDSFLVSGESLARNFLLGMKRAEAFGQTSRIGWLCDIFGHSSQMPQILAQLGIDNALLWRGADCEQSNPFSWEGADGTKILVSRFIDNGYGDFDFDVRRINRPDLVPTTEEMTESALAYFAKTKGGLDRDLLWFSGADHMEFDPAILVVAANLNRLAGREVLKVSTLDHFMAALQAGAPPAEVVQGELREVAKMMTYAWLIPGVGSSRIPLKQANHACETLLTLWTEPWCAAANFALGLEYPEIALELAWEYLLKNHPHDSICGCSPDETHAAMPYRFDQSRQIAEFHRDQACEALAAAALRDQVGDGEIGLSLFAPAGGTPQICPELFLQLPKDWPQFAEFFGYELKPAFRIHDLAGREIAYQLLQVVPSTTRMRVPSNHFPASEDRQGARLVLDATLEPGAARHFVIKRAEGPTRISQAEAIGVGRNTLRNNFLEVVAEDNGTLTLTDLASGQIYSGLLAMEDTADIGDGWHHGVTLQDQGFLSTGGLTTYGLTENGPLLARLRIRVEWRAPAEFDFRKNERSSQFAPIVAEHIVTLRKDAPHAEVETTVHNFIRDHRLRLFCPTGLSRTEHFWADTPFDAVRRPIALRPDNHLLREIQVEMTPQQNWVATSNGERGLALLAPGQYESAVLDQPDRPLCLTLLRAFRRAIFTDGNEGGQIQGTHKFRLALKPFCGAVPATELFHLAQSLAAPARGVCLEPRDFRDFTVQPIAKLDDRPRVEGSAVLSACQKSGEHQWLFRVFNPTDAPVDLRLSGASSWEIENFRGEKKAKIERCVTVAPKQILTLRGTVLSRSSLKADF